MTDGEGLVLLLGLPAFALFAYLLARRSHNSKLKRLGSAAVAVIAGVLGFVGTAGYALPALTDLMHQTPSDVFGVIILCGICLGAFVIALRRALFAIRKDPKSIR
jgi:hypothetical protein